MELTDRHSIFIGFKMDSTLRRALQSLTGADRRYISDEDPAFLMTCKFGKDDYVGKVIDDGLTTDRVDDIRRNILSILHRVCPDQRFPEIMTIMVCDRAEASKPVIDPSGFYNGQG